MLSLVPEIFLEHFLSVGENNLTKRQRRKRFGEEDKYLSLFWTWGLTPTQKVGSESDPRVLIGWNFYKTPKLIWLVLIIWTTEGTGEDIFRRSSWGKFGRSPQGKKLFSKYCIGKLHVLYIFAYTFKIPLCLTWILFPKKSLGHVYENPDIFENAYFFYQDSWKRGRKPLWRAVFTTMRFIGFVWTKGGFVKKSMRLQKHPFSCVRSLRGKFELCTRESLARSRESKGCVCHTVLI